MERILEALANDDLSTMASTIKENPEYEKSMKEICEIENILNAALNPTESGLLKKLEDLQLDVAELSATARFIDGYRLRALRFRRIGGISMYRILEQLYDAPIGLNSIQPGQNPELMKMARNREEKRQKLIAALSPEQKKLLDKLVQADEEMESSRAFDKFKYGFHLGVLMMMEIMESYEDMLS